MDKKKRIIGFTEEGKFYDKKHKLIGYLEGRLVKILKAKTQLRLDEHHNIYAGKDQVGFIYSSIIYFREKPVCEFSKEKREIKTIDGKRGLFLTGNDEKIDQLLLFAIAVVFLESKWWDLVFTSFRY
ncbi:MAG: hypothetical protein JSV62_05090 [Promethearchaeota archaeon]|nr:MAG: hypothetical protein JSV62_05090 [Candidatus Lokiarchaeota archaeon]